MIIMLVITSRINKINEFLNTNYINTVHVTESCQSKCTENYRQFKSIYKVLISVKP